jgi:hypothetical protein
MNSSTIEKSGDNTTISKKEEVNLKCLTMMQL